MKNHFIRSWCITLSMVIVLCATSAPHSDTPMDLLQIPARKSAKAPSSMLLDITDTGRRLVAVGERGHILYTGDNTARRWTQARVPVSVTLTAVAFTTTKKGWAVGHDAVVLHTRDGGQTWEKQLDGTNVNPLMLNQLRRLINIKSRALKRAQQNTDKAQSQKLSGELEDLDLLLSDMQIAAQEGATMPLMDLWFKDEQEGIVIGAYGMILATTDAGANWRPLLDRLDNPQGLHYYGIAQCGNALFIAGERGMLIRSDDWGRRWQRLTSPCTGSFFGIVGRADGRLVIAFGLDGAAVYSHDQGAHWAVATINSPASISGGAVLTDGSICLTGADGALMRSTDGGRSFSRLTAQFPGAVALTPTNIHNLVVVGLKGIKTINIER